MAPSLRAVCVFCGSRAGARPEYGRAAQAFGRLLGERGMTLVYGGGAVGLMGITADAALAAGGRVVGVIPEPLATREVAHAGLSELHVVPSMHARKARMAELADAFVALPGGVGTFEEFFEIVTWSQLGIHRKPVGLLNVARFFDPLCALLDHATTEGFLLPPDRGRIMESANASELLELLHTNTPPPGGAWITAKET